MAGTSPGPDAGRACGWLYLRLRLRRFLHGSLIAAEGRVLRQRVALLFHRPGLPRQEIRDRGSEARIGDEVEAAGLHRQITPRDLVLALGPGLDAGEAVLDGELDRLVVA